VAREDCLISHSVAVSSSHDEVTLTMRITLITDLLKFRYGVVHRSGVDYGGYIGIECHEKRHTLRIAGGTQPLHPLQIIALTDVQ
jgi:hypothetical protein